MYLSQLVVGKPIVASDEYLLIKQARDLDVLNPIPEPAQVVSRVQVEAGIDDAMEYADMTMSIDPELKPGG